MTEKETAKDLRRRSSKRLIATLKRYANSGCLDASRFLCQRYADGVFVEAYDEEVRKYRCLRCLQGDKEECWRFYTEGRMVSCGFIQDHCDWYSDFKTVSTTKVTDDLYIEEKADPESGQTILEEVHLYTENPLKLLLEYDREGTGARLTELAEGGDARAAYDLVSSGFPADGRLTELAGNDPRSLRDSAYELMEAGGFGLGYDRLFPDRAVDAEEAVAVLDAARHVEPDLGYLLAVWYLAGRPVPRDTGKALEYALDAAECGSEEAAGLVAVMLDAPLSTDDDKRPDIDEAELEELKARWGRHMNDYGRMCLDQRPFIPASRPSLQDGAEWRLITNLTDSGYYGECYLEDRCNDSGGFEDEVICIRPFDWGYDEDPVRASRPNFLFKPSGFNMEWYKYPWRSPEMSENLSLGEIRRIWRLCIDHLLTGRTFEPGPTSGILRLSPSALKVPERLRERADRVCMMASEQELRRSKTSGSIYGGTYRNDPSAEGCEDTVREIIGILEKRMEKM